MTQPFPIIGTENYLEYLARRFGSHGQACGWDWGVGSKTQRFNQGYLKLIGADIFSLEFLHENWLQRIHPDDRAEVESQLDLLLSAGSPVYRSIHRMRADDGRYRWICECGIAQRNVDGQAYRVLTVAAPLMQNVSSSSTNALIDNVVDGIITVSSQGIIESANESIQYLLGYTPDELLGKNISMLMGDEIAVCHDEYMQRYQGGGGGSIVGQGLRELVAKHKDGRSIDISLGVNVANIGGREVFVGAFRDVSEQKAAERILRSREKLLSFAQRIAHIGSWSWNVVTGENSWTDEMYRIFGLTPDAFPPDMDQFVRFVHPQDRDQVVDGITAALVFGRTCEIVHRIVRKDGEIRVVLQQGEVEIGVNQKPYYITLVVHDITEQFSAEEQLRKLNENLEQIIEDRTAKLEAKNTELDAALSQAQDATRSKSEFLANMSHEIRTPMNGVLGMLGLLRDSGLSAEQADFASTAYNSAETLLTLLNDILDFSKIEAGKMTLEKIDFDIRSVAEDVVELLAERAHSKGIEISSFVVENVPTMVVGDPTRLRQVLTNLIGNAIKFTSVGEVTLQINYLEQLPGGHRLRVEVRDTGIGIPENARQKIFESFSQADGSTTRNFGGTGLGLTISRQLVQLMDGEIGVDSEVNKGSVFWFTLELGESSVESTRSSEYDVASLRGVRVLVVDDNQTNREIFKRTLAAWSMEVVPVEGHAQALQQLSQAHDGKQDFQVVLLDMAMPECNGMQLAQKIRDLPIVQPQLALLSSMFFGRKDDEYHALNIVHCLNKPVRKRQLYELLCSMVRGQTSSQDVADKIFDLAAGSAKQVVRVERILVAEDNSINQKVISAMLKKSGFEAQMVGNGVEAVKAWENGGVDLIFMDCQMPEMDGYTATGKIRELEQAKGGHVPIVALTANAMQGDEEKCRAAGMDDYLTKPLREKNLQDKLAHWLPQKQNAA
ncbi:MAG: response regulator [Gammaproteobacteria bacterium]|nr:response regulator [Gammaproteobacteria bacterium]